MSRNKPIKTSTCDAKKRDGGKCKAPPMPNGRCRFHGGKSTGAPKGNKNAFKHGLYSKTLTKEEEDIYDDIDVGDLDHEIKIAKIQLRRVLTAQKEHEDGESMLETVKVEVSGVGNAVRNRSATKTLPDFRSIINMYMGKIAGLMKTKFELNESGAGDDPEDIANKIKEALSEVEKSIGKSKSN